MNLLNTVALSLTLIGLLGATQSYGSQESEIMSPTLSIKSTGSDIDSRLKYSTIDIDNLMKTSLDSSWQRLDLNSEIPGFFTYYQKGSTFIGSPSVAAEFKENFKHLMEKISSGETKPKNILLPLYVLKPAHWSLLHLKFDDSKMTAKNIDSFENLKGLDDLMGKISSYIKDTYFKELTLEFGSKSTPYLQPDLTSCGPIMVENILKLTQGAKLPSSPYSLNPEEVRGIRLGQLHKLEEAGLKLDQ